MIKHLVKHLLRPIGIAALFSLTACVHSQTTSPITQTPQAADGIPTPKLAEPPSATPPVVEIMPVPGEIAFNEKGYFERLDLESFDSIHLRFAQSDVSVASGGVKKGFLKILRVQGDAKNCKVFLSVGENAISLSDDTSEMAAAQWESQSVKSALPANAKCQYQVELHLPESGTLVARMLRGNFQLESWNDPARVRMEWGDVDFGEVADLNVLCGRCNLSGEGLKGTLKYQLESGNVGVAGLNGSVEGQTSGDTILKWRHLNPKESVKVASQTGDIILFFPQGVPVRSDVKVPKGDFDSRLSNRPPRAAPETEQAKEENQPNGVPVSVVANLGNVRFYRMK